MPKIQKSKTDYLTEIFDIIKQKNPEIVRFNFVVYQPRPPANIGFDLKDGEKEKKEKSFFLRADKELTANLDHYFKLALGKNCVVGLQSRIRLKGHTKIKNLFMLDLDKSPTIENISFLKKSLIKKLDLRSGLIIASSEEGMYFLSDHLFTRKELVNLYGKSLLLNYGDDQWVDTRYIGHVLNRDLLATLRISAGGIKQMQPQLVDKL